MCHVSAAPIRIRSDPRGATLSRQTSRLSLRCSRFWLSSALRSDRSRPDLANATHACRAKGKREDPRRHHLPRVPRLLGATRHRAQAMTQAITIQRARTLCRCITRSQRGQDLRDGGRCCRCASIFCFCCRVFSESLPRHDLSSLSWTVMGSVRPFPSFPSPPPSLNPINFIILNPLFSFEMGFDRDSLRTSVIIFDSFRF